ncbi:MAG: hypothetical protein WCW93_03735 [Candidatus Paceibacterota bacterium]
MRKSVISLFLLLQWMACAENLSQVQAVLQAFEQGEFEKCEKMISDIKDSKLTKDELLQVSAVKEYIARYSENGIENTLKEARAVLSQPNLLAKDLLDKAEIFTNRAVDWKAHNISQADELSNMAIRLLKRINDSGNPEIAVKVVILQTKILNLRGEYNECIGMILQLLRYYFPDTLERHPQTQSLLAVNLLELIGEQNIALAVRTTNEKEKIRRYSQAAIYYLKAVSCMPKNIAMIDNLEERLVQCQESLRLLGYNLPLPSNIKKTDKSITFNAMIDEMLKQHRYSDIIVALEPELKKTENSQLLLRYAQALAGIGKFTDTLGVIKRVKVLNAEYAATILNLAKKANAAKANIEALELFKIFAESSTDSPEIEMVYLKCANISLTQNDFPMAIKYFILTADKAAETELKSQALLSATQCAYQNSDYVKVIEIATDAMQKLKKSQKSEIEFNLLIARAALKCGKNDLAQNHLNKILSMENLPDKQKQNTLILSSMAAIELKNYTAASELLSTYLTKYPNEKNSVETAFRLVQIYQANNKQKEMVKMGDWIGNNWMDKSDAVTLIIQIAEFLQKSENMSASIAMYEKLLKAKFIPTSQLLKISEHISQHDDNLNETLMEKHKVDFENTAEICELYYRIAELNYRQKKYVEVLKQCEFLLNQKKLYRYFELKILHAESLRNMNRNEDARKDYQEAFRLKPPVEFDKKLTYLFAESWKLDKEYKEAMAIAWTAVPMSGQVLAVEREWVEKSLNLIMQCADKIGAKDDYEEANVILKSLKIN